MKDWFEHFGTVFGQVIRKILKNLYYTIITCVAGGLMLFSFAGTGLCLYHLFTGAPLVSNWLYASPVVFILTLALFETYLNW